MSKVVVNLRTSPTSITIDDVTTVDVKNGALIIDAGADENEQEYIFPLDSVLYSVTSI